MPKRDFQSIRSILWVQQIKHWFRLPEKCEVNNSYVHLFSFRALCVSVAKKCLQYAKDRR